MGLVTQIGFLVIEVSDLEQWRAFGTEVLGLQAADSGEQGFCLRMDQYQRRFMVEQGAADDVTAIGFEVADGAALQQVRRDLQAAGFGVADGAQGDIARRGVANLIRCSDPSGVPLEFYHGPARSASPFHSERVSGFVAGEQGFGHVVVNCRDTEASEAFYLNTLGFRLSDTIVLDLGASQIRIVFTHVNPRHHSLAFALPMPKNIHHFMIQARSIDDVGQAFDRARDFGLQVTQALGRHSNDRMFSFYAKTPSGFEFEFGADAVEIDDASWEPVEYERGSDWGHRPPAAPPPQQAAAPPETVLSEGETLELDSGYQLHYYDSGGHRGGKDRAVVFLHGSGQGASGWSNFKGNVPAFNEQGYRTLVPDLLGFGRSSKPDDVEYTLDFHLAALEQLLDQLALERVVLLGNSLGGALAIYYALRHPERVAQLVLLAPGGVEAQQVYAGMPGLQAMFRVVVAEAEPSPADLREVLSLQLFDPSLLDEQTVAERYQVAIIQPRCVWTSMQVPYLGDAVAELSCPMQVFWGQDDQFLPVSGAEAIRRQCPQAEIVLQAQCGHWVMVEHSELFNRRCLAFLEAKS